MNRKLKRLACILSGLALVNFTPVQAIKVSADTKDQESTLTVKDCYKSIIKRVNKNEYDIYIKQTGVSIKVPTVEVKAFFYYNNGSKYSVEKIGKTQILNKTSIISIKAPAKIASRWSKVRIVVYVDGKIINSIQQTL